MILPSKHLPPSRALINVGGEILSQLDEPIAISELWERVQTIKTGEAQLSFDWFVLALTFLHTIFAIEMRDGLVAISRRPV